MIKSAVVNDSTPCVDSPIRKEAGFYDGEKVSSLKELSDAPKLSKILNNKEKNNELEHSNTVQQ